jgi:two-component system, OmpR family, response regulator
MPKPVLVVDDEPHIREVICFALERAGLKTTTARNGAEALMAVQRQQPSLLVLDIGMPELDGLEVCRQLRRTSTVPILFLSARDEEVDRIVGLELGGDDYVTKPFSPRELVARVKAILKRTENHGAPMVDTVLERGKVRLDRGAHEVTHDGVQVPLTALEFAIMAALLGRPALVFSREQLIEAAYGPQIHVADRTIDSHVRNIRAKFATAGCDVVITTVHGVGFKLGLDGP